MPHGFCYFWNPGLVWLHVFSDSLIALAYFAIPVILLWFARRRRDLPFSWMFVLFGVFIVACGATHLMGCGISGMRTTGWTASSRPSPRLPPFPQPSSWHK